MKPSYIDAIHEMARQDPAVHAFIRMKYQQHMQWDDVLAQLAMHLAKDKANLTARLIDAERNRVPDHWLTSVASAPVEQAGAQPVAYIHSVDIGKSSAPVYSPEQFRSWPLGKKADITPYVPLYLAAPAPAADQDEDAK